jgi:ABC-type proline/glycine betaine transport system permease subunit
MGDLLRQGGRMDNMLVIIAGFMVIILLGVLAAKFFKPKWF